MTRRLSTTARHAKAWPWHPRVPRASAIKDRRPPNSRIFAPCASRHIFAASSMIRRRHAEEAVRPSSSHRKIRTPTLQLEEGACLIPSTRRHCATEVRRPGHDGRADIDDGCCDDLVRVRQMPKHQHPSPSPPGGDSTGQSREIADRPEAILSHACRSWP